MKQISFFYFLLWLFCFQQLNADPIITFFFHECPSNQICQALENKLRKPHGIAKQTIKGVLRKSSVAGIFSSYFGFLNVSDQNGQTMFPRKQSKSSLTLVITNKITPVMMFQYTISHWELVPGVPAAVYQCEQKEDYETKLIFWDIQKATLPENNQIPLQDSLIIIAKPHNIIVPTGITLTQQSANLALPEMYVTKEIQTTRNALYMLDLALFFRPINILYKKEKVRYGTLVSE